ncbi:MAG: hypothetical protein ACRDQZ_08655 [Mycobacteriales bacterium]
MSLAIQLESLPGVAYADVPFLSETATLFLNFPRSDVERLHELARLAGPIAAAQRYPNITFAFPDQGCGTLRRSRPPVTRGGAA